MAAAEHAVAVAWQAAGIADHLSVPVGQLNQALGYGAGAMAEVSDLVAAAGVIQGAAASAAGSMACPASTSDGVIRRA